MTQKTLDAREKLFVAEYLIDLDPKRAALAAGYAKSTAEQKSYGWVRNSMAGSTKKNVFAAILKAQDARLKRLDIDADWILKRLEDDLKADLLDLYDKDGRLLPMSEWPLAWRTGMVQGLDFTETSTGKGDDEVVSVRIGKLKMPDRIKRLELAGKHQSVQAWVERREHSGPGGGLMQVEDKTTYTSMELAHRVLALVAKAEHAPKETEEEAT